MVIRVPDTVVADRYTAGQQGEQDFYKKQLLQRQQLGNIGQDLNAIADYSQDKYLLEQLAQQPQPQQQPQDDYVVKGVEFLEDNGFTTVEDLDEAARDFSKVVENPQQAIPILIDRDNRLTSNNVDSTGTKQYVQGFQTNPQQTLQAAKTMAQLASDPKIRAYMARNPARAVQTMNAFGIQSQGAIDAANAKAQADALGERNKEDAKAREELRGDLRGRLKIIDDGLSSVEANHDKFTKLLKQVDGGSRTAVPQLLVTLVKLNDPNSAVLEAEMATALASKTPAASVKKLLTERGSSQDVIDSVATYFDPNDPTKVDINGIRNTANAMVSANVGAYKTSYDQTRDLAANNLPASGINSLFSGNRDKRFEKLSGIQPTSTVKNDTPLSEDERLELEALRKGQ